MTSEKRLGGYRGFWSRGITDAQYLEKVRARCVRGGDCLRWQGNKNTKGYGQLTYRNRHVMAHRLVYQLAVGPIPAGMHVCHTCDVRDCCNEAHLFLGSNLDNVRDMQAKGRQYLGKRRCCKYGHDFTPENTVWRVTPAGTKYRKCKMCDSTRPWKGKTRGAPKDPTGAERQRRYRARVAT